MDEYYTWEELYYEIYPHLKPDSSFTDKDIIRFFHNNLDVFEQERVLEYFCELCQEDFDQPDIEEPLPELPTPTPVLPPLPVIPQIPIIPIVPSLPPPAQPSPPLLPPTGQEWISPVFPFIIFELLPPDILDWLLHMVGYNDEVEAAELTIGQLTEELNMANSQKRYFEDLYLYWKDIAQQLESWDKYGPPPWIKPPAGPKYDEWMPTPDEEDPWEGETIEEDTPFPDWWEDFENEQEIEEEVEDSTWVGGGFTHGEVLRAIEWLLETDEYDDISYMGWYKDATGIVWYLLKESGEEFEYRGYEVIEWARWYGYPY